MKPRNTTMRPEISGQTPSYAVTTLSESCYLGVTFFKLELKSRQTKFLRVTRRTYRILRSIVFIQSNPKAFSLVSLTLGVISMNVFGSPQGFDLKLLNCILRFTDTDNLFAISEFCIFSPNQSFATLSSFPRYQASSAEPPRGGYLSSSQGSQPPRQYTFQGTNPWEREEREKEQLRRREAAKIWRDQQISELGALGANRTQSQEEQLRALRLEKEFERRAEEEEDEEEEDQVRGGG